MDELIDTLRRYPDSSGSPPIRAICFDTVARCMGEGDENSARDMGRYVTRCERLSREFGCVIVSVHHTGKDASKGMRGSSALLAAVDVALKVEKGRGRSRVTITEMKDGPEGVSWEFQLVPFGIAKPADDAAGEHWAEQETCIVEILSEPGRHSATEKPSPPTGVAVDLLKIVRSAIEERGQTGVDSLDLPAGAAAVSRDDLKASCKTAGWQQDKKPASFRAIFSKNIRALRDHRLIGCDRHWIWLGGAT